MKDREIGHIVGKLVQIARKDHDSPQLRERIGHEIIPTLKGRPSCDERMPIRILTLFGTDAALDYWMHQGSMFGAKAQAHWTRRVVVLGDDEVELYARVVRREEDLHRLRGMHFAAVHEDESFHYHMPQFPWREIIRACLLDRS